MTLATCYDFNALTDQKQSCCWQCTRFRHCPKACPQPNTLGRAAAGEKRPLIPQKPEKVAQKTQGHGEKIILPWLPC